MSTVIDVVAPRLLGPALMVAAAIIVKGYGDVGDGFSAGVIVALAVALRYVTVGPDGAEQGLPFTHYPPPGDPVVKIGTVELITAVAFDVGLFLLVAGALVTLVHQLARLVEGRSA